MNEVLDYLYSTDGLRRIALFLSDSGSVVYAEEYWYRNELAGTEGWARIQTGNAYYADIETARRELRSTVPFLVSISSDEQDALALGATPPAPRQLT